MKVLIVDDEGFHLEATTTIVRTLGHETISAKSGEEALQLIDVEGDVEVVLADVKMEPINGLELVDKIRSRPKASCSPYIILMTSHAAEVLGVGLDQQAGIIAGADDYVNKNFIYPDRLRMQLYLAEQLGTVLKNPKTTKEEKIKTIVALRAIASRNPQMIKVLGRVHKVAKEKVPVLLQGESGTGKEIIAHMIHQLSPRKNEKFFAINCGAISKDLIESELFGHVVGSFSGGTANREGAFRTAHKGTLFLDEIGDLLPELQGKLLRALEERKVKPVGSDEENSVDVRVIAASKSNLRQLVEERKFREDLYYRLSRIRLELPRLQERPEDIEFLAITIQKDLRTHGDHVSKTACRITPDAVKALKAYRWPGNVRELLNAIEFGLIMAEGECLDVIDLPSEILSEDSEPAEGIKLWNIKVEAAERQIAMDALRLHDRSIPRAARWLGLTDPGLRSILNRLSINPPNRP